MIERLADGTNCLSCAARVLEEQPSLLRPRTAAPSPFQGIGNSAAGTSEVETYMADSEEEAGTAGESQAQLAPLAPGRHLRHLPGGTAPDMRAAPDGHWPNEPA